MHLIFKRVLAWLIDWVIVLLYATFLFSTMSVLAFFGIIELEQMHPLKGQLVGFFTLTLPVVLYCIVFEAGKRHATPGKRVMKIEVTGTSLTTRGIILRNSIKFIPWEMAHAGVLWLNYINTPETPLWVWILLIGPQVLVILYFMSLVATKGSSSVYDQLARTRVRHIVSHSLPVAIFFALVLQPVSEGFIQQS